MIEDPNEAYKRGYRDGYADGVEDFKKKEWPNRYPRPWDFPDNPWPYPRNSRCPKCGIDVTGPMCYSCPDSSCPFQPKATF
jgi:hypothetical protein